MRRREPEDEPQPDVPADLLAGPCIELWAPDAPRGGVELDERADFVASSRWTEARREWLTENGLRDDPPEPLRYGAQSVHPWSFHDLADDEPARLAEVLAERGLPPSWRPPTHATPTEGENTP